MNFPVDEFLEIVREAVRPYPPAAMFDLRDRGFHAIWQQLAACVLSIRTRDEDSHPASLRLFALCPTPESLRDVDEDALAAAIAPTAYPVAKIPTLLLIGALAAENGGDLPESVEALTAIRGIGPKCAHLALGVARNVPMIAVDVHVHRIVNRWGYVAAPTPEKTLVELEKVLPREWRVEINALLVPFGKHICAARPKCPVCPLRDRCPKIGVGASADRRP